MLNSVPRPQSRQYHILEKRARQKQFDHREREPAWLLLLSEILLPTWGSLNCPLIDVHIRVFANRLGLVDRLLYGR
jgi:hypothetical protein